MTKDHNNNRFFFFAKTHQIIFVILATLFLTSCCKIRSQMEVVIEEGYLYTPDGKYEFERLSYSDLREIDPRYRDKEPEPRTYIAAKTKDFIVAADPANGGAGTWLVFITNGTQNNSKLLVDANSSLFETRKNGKLIASGKAIPPQSLEIKKRHMNSTSPAAVYFYGVSLSSMMDGITPDDQTFRYVIPFSIDQQEYKIDVAVSFKKDHYIDFNDWHFPGTP